MRAGNSTRLKPETLLRLKQLQKEMPFLLSYESVIVFLIDHYFKTAPGQQVDRTVTAHGQQTAATKQKAGTNTTKTAKLMGDLLL